MIPRSCNGVVDPELLVYGTENVRVVDLSIMPLHIAAHTQGECCLLIREIIDLYSFRQLRYTPSRNKRQILSRPNIQRRTYRGLLNPAERNHRANVVDNTESETLRSHYTRSSASSKVHK